MLHGPRCNIDVAFTRYLCNVLGVPTTVSDSDLLDAAKRVFAAHGYAGATLERLAAEAGVNRATLHRRGVNKDDLLAQLAARGTEVYRQEMWPALTATGSGAARLGLALEALCRSTEANLELLVALNGRTEGIFHRDEPEPLTRDVFTDPLARILQDGAADGSLREVDVAETATVLFNMVGWTYMHLRTGHGWSPDRARAGTLDPLLRGLIVAGEAGG
jgi:AcrR family transcriptional regulator